MEKLINTKSGQSLFEVVVALAVVTLITVAIVILATYSIKNSTFSTNKTTASRYTQEAIEWILDEREQNKSDFFSHVTVPIYCLDSLYWDNVGVCSDTEYVSGTNLVRQIDFSSQPVSGKNVIQAVVTVYWNDSQGYHEVRSDTYLTDTREL